MEKKYNWFKEGTEMGLGVLRIGFNFTTSLALMIIIVGVLDYLDSSIMNSGMIITENHKVLFNLIGVGAVGLIAYGMAIIWNCEPILRLIRG